MAWMYAKKTTDGNWYPVIGIVNNNQGVVFGVPRWQTKKWKLADLEVDEFDIKCTDFEKKKISIPWSEWKTLEERVEKVIYMTLWMLHGTEKEKDPYTIVSAVTPLTQTERFELVVDGYGNAHLLCPRDEEDDLEAFEKIKKAMAEDNDADREYRLLTKMKAEEEDRERDFESLVKSLEDMDALRQARETAFNVRSLDDSLERLLREIQAFGEI